jgi:flagellar biosynthesis protein FlhA
MVPTAAGFGRNLLQRLSQHYGLVLPLAIIGAILVIVVPLPPALLDLLLATNITLSIVILMATVSVRTPLELSVFPSLLLSTTLLRLVLNVASTRLILTRASSAGTAAAGGIIQKFGELVAGDRIVVGAVIFAIIVVIQFVVITKGATRISEVSARFVLDAMPGRQMAIDADLGAGLIDEASARRQRDELVRSADFFGAMDGASKFVRGDAVASVVITIVNIVGGLYVGVIDSGMTLAHATDVFTKLTIGDGLVTQVPAFIVALAAALLITRPSTSVKLGEETVRQLTLHPEALVMAGMFALMLATTNFPRFPLLVLASVCAVGAYWIARSRRPAAEPDEQPRPADPEPAVRIEEFLHIDPMELEIGYGLLRFADRSRGGDLIERLQQLRQQTAQNLGLILPKLRIRDNLEIGPQTYVVRIRGKVVSSGNIPVNCYLARGKQSAPKMSVGAPAPDAPFGPNCWWIDANRRGYAERQGFQVLDAAGAILFELRRIIEEHAADLLSRDQVKRLLDSLKERSPVLVDDVVPRLLATGQVHRLLQNLLRDRRSIRDLETILETVGDHATTCKDIDMLTEYVGQRLDRQENSGDGQRRFAAAAA